VSVAHDVSSRPPGRPAGATRDDVVAVATRQYLAGLRVDVRAIATEVGVGRTTIYRWFGSRDELVGEVLRNAFHGLIHVAESRQDGRGTRAVLATMDRINRWLAGSEPLRCYLEQEGSAALRLITASNGPVQPYVVDWVAAMIERALSGTCQKLRIDSGTLAYAMVRLSEAFLFNDAIAGIRGDVQRLHDVQAAILGVASDHANSGAR
jgi:AcrR family transcriptional regulator